MSVDVDRVLNLASDVDLDFGALISQSQRASSFSPFSDTQHGDHDA
ncbi:hypothetical protein L4C36_03600 [Photobacterium japonica]